MTCLHFWGDIIANDSIFQVLRTSLMNMKARLMEGQSDIQWQGHNWTHPDRRITYYAVRRVDEGGGDKNTMCFVRPAIGSSITVVFWRPKSFEAGKLFVRECVNLRQKVRRAVLQWGEGTICVVTSSLRGLSLDIWSVGQAVTTHVVAGGPSVGTRHCQFNPDEQRTGNGKKIWSIIPWDAYAVWIRSHLQVQRTRSHTKLWNVKCPPQKPTKRDISKSVEFGVLRANWIYLPSLGGRSALEAPASIPRLP